MAIRPKFIRSQRVFRLSASPEWQRDALRPDFFRQRPDVSSNGAPPSGLSQRICWVQVADREQYFADPSILRLCLTVDAGVGKTTAIRQIAYLRQNLDPVGTAS